MENITLGNLTLITGSNGSGKTRYIKSIPSANGFSLRYLTFGSYTPTTSFNPYVLDVRPFNSPLQPRISVMKDWMTTISPSYNSKVPCIDQGKAMPYVHFMVMTLLHSMPGDTVVLENPELYLHPNAQSRLAELCVLVSNAGIRVVIEANSEHILNGILVGAIRHKLIAKDLIKVWYLNRCEDGYNATEVIVGDHGRIRNAPDGFFDQLAKDLRVLMSRNNI